MKAGTPDQRAHALFSVSDWRGSLGPCHGSDRGQVLGRVKTRTERPDDHHDPGVDLVVKVGRALVVNGQIDLEAPVVGLIACQ